MLHDLLRDVRQACRQLRNAPSFALAAVATLALGVGANTAIFSIVNGLLLRPLPFPQPERLLFVDGLLSNPDRDVSFQLSYPDLQTLRARAATLAMVTPWNTAWGLALESRDGAQRLEANFVGQDYFTILGASPLLGRTFTAADHARGADDRLVAILSEGTWRQAFGGDPAIIGRDVRLQNRVFTVIGVMPRAFSDVPESQGDRVDVWAPIERAPSLFGLIDLDAFGSRQMWGVARLADGATVEAAREELRALAAGVGAANPATNTRFSYRADPLASRYFVDARRPLWLLLGGSIFVLLIGCANVANLLLVRSADRAREFGVRLAMGAGRWRLARQLFAESLVLSLAGAGAGILLAAWMTPVLVELSGMSLPQFSGVGLDGQVLAVALATALVCGVLFGFAPMWRAGHASARDVLAGASGRVTRASRTARWLAGVEVAAAFVLAAGALVTLQSLSSLLNTDLSFRTDRLLTVRLELPPDRYGTPAARARAGEELRQRLAALPGVEHATLWGPGMFARATWVAFLSPADRLVRDTERLMVWRHSTNPGGLRDLGIRLTAGRDFSDRDTLDSPLVAIVSEATAARLWPGADPIGRQVRTSAAPDAPVTTVIGVAGDVRHRGRFRFSDGANAYRPQLDIYLPFAQRPNSLVVFGVRTFGDPDAATGVVRAAVAGLDPALPVYDVESLASRQRAEEAPLAFAALLINLYGGLAVLLAGIGVYGVLAAAVAGRRREIGIKAALGAEPRRLLASVVREGLSISAVASAAGAAIAWAMLQAFSSLLFDAGGGHGGTLAAAAVIVAVLTLLASIIPARRAAGVDPIRVLRDD